MLLKNKKGFLDNIVEIILWGIFFVIASIAVFYLVNFLTKG